MISRLLLPAILVLPLGAQAPEPQPPHAVRILLQADKPPLGTPALDTAAIIEKLKAFAKDENLVPPAPDGDGWIIGIGLITQKDPDGLLVGGGTVRLTPVRHGKTIPNEAKDSGVLVVAWKSQDLCSALGYEVARRSQELLVGAKVVPDLPLIRHEVPASSLTPPTGQSDPFHPHAFEFSQVAVRSQPPPAPYPVEAKKNNVKGTVVVEIAVDPTGTPTSVTAIEGPSPLLPYACGYAIHWRFKPLTLNGHPEYGRFKMNFHFELH